MQVHYFFKKLSQEAFLTVFFEKITIRKKQNLLIINALQN